MATHDTQAQALALHALLASIDITRIPVSTKERSIPRKVQTQMARSLFKKLGLKGISVTTPNYSMAQTVDVRLPSRKDYVLNAIGQVVDYASDPAACANRQARDRVMSILLAAFPNHDDRSDSRTDYFNSKWSVE